MRGDTKWITSLYDMRKVVRMCEITHTYAVRYGFFAICHYAFCAKS